MKRYVLIAGVVLTILFQNSLFIKAKTKVLFGADYISELQSDFGQRLKWGGLLQTNLNIHFPHEKGSGESEFSIELITVYNTSSSQVANDLQGFSNIDAPDLLLSPFLMGYTYSSDKYRIFAGLRNVNEDYFTTDYTSLFTQSSAGIHPVLSANFELADYPQTGLALFCEMNPSLNLRIRSSVYNGVSGTFYGRGNHPFKFDYRKNGIFLIQDILLTKRDTRYNFGALIHFSGDQQKRGGALWGIVEKSVYSTNNLEVGVVGDASCAFMSAAQCASYGSFGVIVDGLFDEKGRSIISSRLFCADFRGRKEFDLELNWLYSFNSRIQIQPAMHLLFTDRFCPVIICRGIYRF